MTNETNIAEMKWNEWCDKNGIVKGEPINREQLDQFYMSDEFSEVLSTLPPDYQVTYCVSIHAWNRLKKLYEEFKKEQAYYPLAFKVEALLAKYEQWKASQPNKT